ncbi:recombinase family protein [Streptomyces mirabilis]|uniref:recombinase family protein n=1 Tax=Streptomyces mirabilis TaxID=68239 RepID=UPI00381D2219
MQEGAQGEHGGDLREGVLATTEEGPDDRCFVRKTPECAAHYEIVETEAALVAELFGRYVDEGASIAGLTRWLTATGTPTRTGKSRWDRSVVWGMLRNPAYAGAAVFGKTQGAGRERAFSGRLAPPGEPGGDQVRSLKEEPESRGLARGRAKLWRSVNSAVESVRWGRSGVMDSDWNHQA